MKDILEINKEKLRALSEKLWIEEVDTSLLSKISKDLYPRLIKNLERLRESHEGDKCFIPYITYNKLTEGFLFKIYENSYYEPKYNKTLCSSYKGFGPKLTSLIEQYFKEKDII